ncbi:endospore germination permease [Halalkalibacter krulwichiae]|uniref:Spore germination protein YndE n=1 Tax=Halalkalibacter krulwichiae TaxID=199441 RepID=A0A1X9MIS6_9BACI|nr:endospore germination permease [Halalkalibacter krulwichiae]ARK32704.1 Spore germination protein YndE [Halalkalibacter krulwichiae]
MSFSRLQLLFVLLLFVGISNHVLIVPHLLGAAKRDAWISVLVAYGILIAWALICSFIFRKNPQRKSLYDWLEERTGKKVSYLILTFFFLYFIVIGFISFFDLIVSVKIYFIPLTPTWFVALPFLLICIWTAIKGMTAIVYSSAIILPIVWMLGHFVAFTTMDNKDYSYLLPILADNEASLIRGVLVVLGGSVDLLVLFVLQQYVNKPISYKYLFILITLLTGLILGPTIGSLAAFGPNVAADMRFPAFEQ